MHQFSYKKRIFDQERMPTDIKMKGAASANNQDASKQAPPLPPGFGFSASTRKYRTDRLKLPNNRNVGPCSLPETYVDNNNVKKTEDDNLDSSGCPEDHYNKANNSCIIFMEFNVCIVCEHPIREFEEDGLTVKYCSEELLPRTPNEVPLDFANNMPVKKKQRGTTIFCSCISGNKTRPCVESRIYIAHEAADTRKGDYFGADLRTYKDKFEDGSVYYRHCLVNIQHNGPAEGMKFQASDEIVLFNDEFAPELKSSAVLALFRSVKVDGQTPLKLVIRRKTTDLPETKPYTWIEVTAILAPDKQTEDQVIVEKSSFKPLRNNRFDIVRSLHLYEIPGSQLFLKIENDTVSADVLDGTIEQSKILRRLQYWEDEKTGRIIYAAALCEESMTKYISTDKDCSVVLDKEPQWFHMSKQGADISFTVDGKYFAFDREHGKAVIQTNEFKFNEYPANKREVLERLLASPGALDSSRTTSQVSISSADENIGENNHRVSRENSSIESSSIHRVSRENSIDSSSSHRGFHENSSIESSSISSSTMSLSQRSETSHDSRKSSQDPLASSLDGSSGYGGSLTVLPYCQTGFNVSGVANPDNKGQMNNVQPKENILNSPEIVALDNIVSSQTMHETPNTTLLAKGLLLESKETSV